MNTASAPGGGGEGGVQERKRERGWRDGSVGEPPAVQALGPGLGSLCGEP